MTYILLTIFLTLLIWRYYQDNLQSNGEDKQRQMGIDARQNRLAYWNSLHRNEKILLLRHIKKNITSDSILDITEQEFDDIFSCSELDFSIRKERYMIDPDNEKWILTSSTTPYEIESIGFCKYFKAIKKINLAGQPITSFKGLENKKDLLEIDASYTKVENFESLNHCSALEYLYLDGASRKEGVEINNLMLKLPACKIVKESKTKAPQYGPYEDFWE